MDKQVSAEMEKLRGEFDSPVETIEIMNDKELVKGIKRSIDDVRSGRIRLMNRTAKSGKTEPAVLPL